MADLSKPFVPNWTGCRATLQLSHHHKLPGYPLITATRLLIIRCWLTFEGAQVWKSAAWVTQRRQVLKAIRQSAWDAILCPSFLPFLRKEKNWLPSFAETASEWRHARRKELAASLTTSPSDKIHTRSAAARAKVKTRFLKRPELKFKARSDRFLCASSSQFSANTLFSRGLHLERRSKSYRLNQSGARTSPSHNRFVGEQLSRRSMSEGQARAQPLGRGADNEAGRANLSPVSFAIVQAASNAVSHFIPSLQDHKAIKPTNWHRYPLKRQTVNSWQ